MLKFHLRPYGAGLTRKIKPSPFGASALRRQILNLIRRALNSDVEIRPHPLFALWRKIANDVAEHSVFAVVFGFEATGNVCKLLRRLVRKGASQLLCGDMSWTKEQIRRAAVLILAYRA
ncbi:hypothetical protein [uncultured Campylobacter sp.]|uniref:hypothetical protein n=1 Tax=uncultured Campylobacter sp. TaxID=218934 RepID=UPI0026383BEF|nr:hypothetical protein [uncultured Campylobacter sp.]